MVQPPQRFTVTCFNNPTIQEAVHHTMAEAGVELYQGYYLAQWNDGKGVSADGGEVYCASFTSDTKPLKLECSVFFCFSRKAVDYDAFKGRLVLYIFMSDTRRSVLINNHVQRKKEVHSGDDCRNWLCYNSFVI